MILYFLFYKYLLTLKGDLYRIPIALCDAVRMSGHHDKGIRASKRENKRTD